MIAYFRQIKKEVYFGEGNPYLKQILLSQVKDLEFELHCMKMYLKMMNYLLFKLENNYTPLEDDLKEIMRFKEQEDMKLRNLKPEGEPISFKTYMGLVYRTERKIIVRSQIEICLFLILLL